MTGSGEGSGFGEEPGVFAAALRGDALAVERLLACIAPEMTSFCRGRLAGTADRATGVDDVVQEILLAVAAALPRFASGDAWFRGWVYGIARHKIADTFRRADRRRPASGTPVDLADVAEPADTAPGPAEIVLRRELAGRLQALLDDLPERSRRILELRILGEQPVEVVAAALGMSPVAVRVAQHRALNVLRRLAADRRAA